VNVWILQTGEPLHVDSGLKRPMRAMNLANALIDAGHNVVVFSADFSHTDKKHRFGHYKEIKVNEQLQYRLIPSPGYRRHIGLKRLYDHWVMGCNLAELLKQESQRPDVAFVGFPPIEVAHHMIRWLKIHKIPSLIDVKDQWPDLFVNALPLAIRPIGRIAFRPYFYMAKKAMRSATGISAMAKGFLDWALSFAGRQQNSNDRVVPLTRPQQSVDGDAYQVASAFWQLKGVSAERTKVVFIGTHSVAFDMAPVVTAARYFAGKENNVDFVICGEGPMMRQWKQAFGNAANVYFPGWIDSAQIEVLLASSLAVLAPYFSVDNFTTNVPNKVVDGLSHGKPILTGLKGEVEALVKGHQVGLFYGDDERSLEQCIELLLGNEQLLSNIETNAFNLYQDQFEFNHVYKGLVAHLEELARAGVRIN